MLGSGGAAESEDGDERAASAIASRKFFLDLMRMTARPVEAGAREDGAAEAIDGVAFSTTTTDFRFSPFSAVGSSFSLAGGGGVLATTGLLSAATEVSMEACVVDDAARGLDGVDAELVDE